MEKFLPYLPYFVSIVGCVLSGFFSYIVARRQSKNDLKKFEDQMKFEREKLETEFQQKLAILNKQKENDIEATLIREAMNMPEVRQQIAQGVKEGMKKGKR